MTCEKMNTDSMNRFVGQISKKYCKEFVVMVVDLINRRLNIINRKNFQAVIKNTRFKNKKCGII